MKDNSASTSTVTTVPAFARLTADFDRRRLADDLDLLLREQWRLQNTIADDGSLTEAPIDWRCLPLRSIGGDPDRTDPGGPGRTGFADTPWMDHAPYLREVLTAIPAQKRCARLMALGSGASSTEHNDNKYGPAWGTARVHVPISTNPQAWLYLDGVGHQWQPGSFWFGDFSRPHRVTNTGETTRVHLVVDCLVSDELIDLFPREHRTALRANALVNREPIPLPDGLLPGGPVSFDLPPSFANWEEPDGEFTRTGERVPATLDLDPADPVLRPGRQSPIGLVHLGEGEFRFAGWTDERTLQVVPGGGIVLRSRIGSAVRELTVRPRTDV